MRHPVLKVLVIIGLAGCHEGAPSYDIMLTGGRVINPETGLDAIRNVGIRGDLIAIISTASLVGGRMIDARGLVVAPGSSTSVSTRRVTARTSGWRWME